MRNLKKTLCLVLALVFVLGLCTVGAASVKFSDAEDIQYTTAVTAMTGLGIIEGYPDGTFKPQKDVSRAEAAKIIAYVVVGPEVEKWPAKQVFDDVPADHWAAKYITFCEYHDIIAGYGGGKFGPDDPVKQDQLAKMLLAACGYGKKDELVGEGWDQNAAKLAFQNGILKGIKSTDWDAPATREETALLAYNTMMTTHRVALSEDTDSYEPEYINGIWGPTFAQSPWGLISVTGVVTLNKSNSLKAKGTTIEITDGYLYDDDDELLGKVEFVSDCDDDPSILGHEVNVMFRQEGDKFVAYFIGDACTEVDGLTANEADVADAFYNVYNGNVKKGAEAYTKKARYTDLFGTYVLNAEGKVVARKFSTYTVEVMKINPVTGLAYANGKEIPAPEGSKNGDYVTVYPCGELYTAKACTIETEQDIFQKKLGVYMKPDYSMYYCYSYNDGAIVTTRADNIGAIELTAASPLNIGVDTNYDPDLAVGWTYTLYFDAEGGCFAYSDGVKTAVDAAADYVLFVKAFTMHDEYGIDQYYAQIVKGDGSVDKVLCKTGGGLHDPADKNTAYIIVNDVELVKGNLVAVIPGGLALPTKGYMENEKYPAGDPTYDFSNARYVCYSGELSTLKADTASRPDTKEAEITYTYTYVKQGTTWMTIVDTVWFTKAAGPAPVAAQDSFIYIVSPDIVERRIVDEKIVDFYDAYKDGEAFGMRPAKDIAPEVGIYSYSLNEKTGEYTLTELKETDGSAIGYREVTLESFADAKTNGTNFILNGKLYVKDAKGAYYGLDLSGVKVVPVDDDAVDAKLDSIAAIETLLKDNEHTVTVKFVEYVFGTAHSFGGNVIYVIGVTEAAE